VAHEEPVAVLPITKLLHGLAHQRTVQERETTAKQPHDRALRKTIVKLRLVQGHRITIVRERETIAKQPPGQELRITVRRNRKTIGQERETTAKQPHGRALRRTIVKLRLVQGHRRTIGPEQKTIVRKIIAT